MHYIQKYWEQLAAGEGAGVAEKKENGQAASAQDRQDFVRVPLSSRIIFYYNYYSFYSQKVMMVLHEKQLEYDPVVVDITKGEQYSSWFLDINPRGEVPVLQDGTKLIPDSTRIIDYIEQYTPNDPHPLLNVTSDAKVSKDINKYRDMLDSIPAGVITMGSFFHPELCGQPKLPFILSVRNTLKSAEVNNSNNLRKLAEENPKAKSTLLYKADIHDRKHELLANKDEYMKVLDQVDDALNIIEIALENQPEEGWLCCEQFTIADISLSILLERLYTLGFEERFWAHGKRPRIQQYFTRVRERPSYKAAIPSLPFHIKLMLSSQPPVVLGLISVASITVAVGTIYMIKKIIF